MSNDNLPVRPLLPGLITSIYDSTLFVFKEKSNNSDGWYLVDNKNTGKQGGKQSVYSKNIGGTDFNGLHVRLTVTINVLGFMATPFISVTGISRGELPLDKCPSDVSRCI